MDYRYKHLEQELSALSKVFSDLGMRLSEVAKEVTSQGVMPSEKLLEQISATRTSFENCRTAIHTHAGAMLVSPLPKIGELVSIAAIDSLLKASAVAEQNKLSIETERDKALAILGRVLAITHRETTEFKPLQECHAKLAELRSGVSSVVWPHRHPMSESIAAGQHPAIALLSFVENVDSLDDERWMTLETTITETYGKPLFVAASRGKLAAGEEVKAAGHPVVSKAPVAAPAPTPAKAPVVAPPEAPKPIAAEKPVEKKTVAEKAPEKPAAPAPAAPVAAPVVSAEKKIAAPPAPVAPAATAPVQAVAVERKEAAQDRVPQKPAAPPVVTAVPVAPVVSIEKPQPVAAPSASAPAVSATPVVTQIPVAPQAAATVVSVPHAVVAPSPAQAAPVASVPVIAAPAPPRPQTPAPVAVQTAPAPVAAAPAPGPTPSAAQPVVGNSHAPAAPQHAAATSLSALANATESSDKRPGAPAPVESIDRRKEPRLAAPAPQTIGKTESNGEEFSGEEGEKAVAGDASQRPQRWGFWRGNRT